MKAIFNTDRRHSRGFTMTEMLVAVAVMALLALLLNQVVDMIQRTIRLSSQATDAASQARIVFARMSNDFAALVNRRDVNHDTLADLSGNGQNPMVFLAEVPAGVTSGSGNATPMRRLSLVGYRLATDDDGKIVLQRGTRGYEWSEVPPIGFDTTKEQPTAEPLPASDIQDNDYDTLSEGTFQIAVTFQRRHPTQTQASVNSDDGGRLTTDIRSLVRRQYQLASGIQADSDHMWATNVGSILVGLVVIDLESRKLLTPEQLTSLQSRFAPNLGDNETPLQKWAPILDDSNFYRDGGIPLRAAQGIRVYQRYFPLN